MLQPYNDTFRQLLSVLLSSKKVLVLEDPQGPIYKTLFFLEDPQGLIYKTLFLFSSLKSLSLSSMQQWLLYEQPQWCRESRIFINNNVSSFTVVNWFIHVGVFFVTDCDNLLFHAILHTAQRFVIFSADRLFFNFMNETRNKSRDTYRQPYWSFFSTFTFQTLHQNTFVLAELFEIIPKNARNTIEVCYKG